MIHIIVGSPCSGKSTFVENNAKENDLRIDYDKIALCLGASEPHIAEGLVKEVAFEVRNTAIECALKNPDCESWIIHTFPSEEQLKRYQEAGAEIIVMDTDKETCIERAIADGRPQVTFDGIDKYFSEKKGRSMEHLMKSFEMKAKDDNGTIAGYFSTYEKSPDSYGDIIEPGAFTNTLAKRKETGHPFPLCFNHDFDKIIGVVDLVEEREKGAYIEAHFLDTELAQDVRKFVQSGAVYQFSFAYDVLKNREPSKEEKANGVMNVLQEVEVFEISVVTVPANQNAVVTEVKTAEPEVKTGRRNRKSDEDIIRSCIKSLESLLSDEDISEEAEAKPKEVTPEVNEHKEGSEEQKDNDNLKKASDLLEKINQFKGGSENES